ncbi:hypothetical protein PN471_18895 [Aphanizomenon sp. CS-733/32]|uniref:hypothetical protein n=1 Tax=Aphanizomenon sp. CS-733/32 TaxID=3021715 RepID=UPI00232ABE08|nr:hypothetical protein [Aphanizomenon sp. CS-733/32]MDB9310653.1 hypothetical protein [Aphanizomenon sp. CS-733/32]
MAQLTIQVPDELANRLQSILHRLPELLSQLVKTHTPETLPKTLNLTNSTDLPITYTEVLDFLIKQPTPEQIAKFKVSNQAQTRLQELLEKNHEGTISAAENSELDIYEQLDQLMMLLKARAYSIIEND